MDGLFRQFSYENIRALNENHGVYLLEKDGEHFVGKILTVYNTDVYKYLKNNFIKNTPKIIEYHELTINEQNVLVVIEEYIEGQTLSDRLSKETISEDETLRIIQELLVIVEHFHQAVPPIIHRDIKPSNIILDENGKVHLLDMNAAKRQNESQYRDTQLIGTAGYAAPEQYGFSASDVRTDIYSIGVLMNVMLTGKFPIEKIYDGELGKIINKCTKLEPDERYQSAKELIFRLIDFEKTKDVQKIQNPKKEEKFIRGLPPGYRKLNPISIVFSTIGYAFMFAIGFSLEVQNSNSMVETWFSRISFMIACIVVILFSADYLDIQKKLHIKDIKNIFLRIILIVLIDCFAIFMVALIAVILEGFFIGG